MLFMPRLLFMKVLENALIAAGLVDDAREMLPRLNCIITEMLVAGAKSSVPDSVPECSNAKPDM